MKILFKCIEEYQKNIFDVVVSWVCIIFLMAGIVSSLHAQEKDDKLIITGPSVSKPAKAKVFTGNIKSLPKVAADELEGIEVNPRKEVDAVPFLPSTILKVDPLLQLDFGVDSFTPQAEPIIPTTSVISSPILNFDGVRTGANPHDPVGDVGPNHYVQMINAVFAIYDKSGNLLAGPSNINSLWTSMGISGTPCSDNNRGDPIVLYDDLADRWLLSQFTGPSETTMCIAISQTPDPTGLYFLYEFDVGEFPDYPKFGIWPDGYYLSANLSAGNTLAAVFERTTMLNGNPALQVNFTVSGIPGLGFDIFMPSDLDGQGPPPTGSPNYFYRQVDGEAFGGSDRLEIFEFHVDWLDPLVSTFTGPINVPLSAFDMATCGFLSFACIPQPGTSILLDPINEPPMWRSQYRNFVSHETLVGSFVVDVDGLDNAGIRWFELRKSGINPWTVHQEGTYAPQPTNPTSFEHRWLSSIAMNMAGNIALGYSVSNSTDVFPSIRYTGRLANDPAGLMTQGEETIINGGNSINSNRWGDYSSLNVDPVDQCTFWYTNDYVTATGLRQTRIATFNLTDVAGGDFNSDCCVDRGDLDIVLACVRGIDTCEPYFDLNNDGNINIADARKLVTLFNNPRGESCQAIKIVSGNKWRSSDTFHADWEKLSYDDSGWNVARSPYPNPSTPDNLIPDTTAQHMWHDPDGIADGKTGANEVFLRFTFNLDAWKSGLAQISVDDDYDLYVNGNLIFTNHDQGNADVVDSVDITSHLQNGKNVIAIHAVDGGWGDPRDRLYERVLFDATIR